MQLQFMQHLELANMLDTLISLLGAFILGGIDRV
jgi:putative Mg2+ transporter-C (MgtC) family protein